jgi:hypothetical protein
VNHGGRAIATSIDAMTQILAPERRQFTELRFPLEVPDIIAGRSQVPTATPGTGIEMYYKNFEK